MPKVVDDSRVFAATIDRLMAHGYGGATTRDIAVAAGINEVTLFRRYGSKAGLVEQAIATRLADTPLNGLVHTGNLETDLLAIVEAYLETNRTHGDIIPIMLIEMTRHADLRSSVAVPWRNLQRAIGIIQRYQKDGLLRDEPPVSAIGSLLGPVMFGEMLRRASPNLGLAVPTVDPKTHVKAFLHGRLTRDQLRDAVG
jgi:AcrR family transcriptional regulator